VRRAFEFLTKQVLRSRYGVALLLAGTVLVILTGARLLGGDDNAATGLSPAEGGRQTTTVNPTAGDDGVTSPAPPQQPVTSPGTARPLAVAQAFAAAWVPHRVSEQAWYTGLLPHSTPTLAAKLSGVDPGGVPADRITGEPTLVPRGATFVEVTFPVDTGVLRLRLVAPEGRWLVDGVDWERA
jgi:hypothetical protein